MYIFEFEEKLNKDDLSNIWQGLMPRCAKEATTYDSTHPENRQMIEHKLDEDNFFEGKEIPEDIQWMTFKVKKKADIDYYKLTADSIDDKDFKFKVENDAALKPDYSYNWPYDYCSLIEMARVSGGVSIIPEQSLGEVDEEEQKIIAEILKQEVEYDPPPVVMKARKRSKFDKRSSSPGRPPVWRATPKATTVGNSSLVSQSNNRIFVSARSNNNILYEKAVKKKATKDVSPIQVAIATRRRTGQPFPKFSPMDKIMGGTGFGGTY
jgi:hypothetical protein